MDIKILQETIGAIFHYARGTYGTMMTTIKELASVQSKGTESTKNAILKFLNYCATHNDENIRYYTSEMILHVHSDASSLSASRARSRVGGHLFLSKKNKKKKK